MAQTIADITVTPIWQSINTLASIVVATSIIIDNKSTSLVILAEGTQPAADSKDGVPLTTFKDTKSSKSIAAGSLEIWARVHADTGTATLCIQED